MLNPNSTPNNLAKFSMTQWRALGHQLEKSSDTARRAHELSLQLTAAQEDMVRLAEEKAELALEVGVDCENQS
jgi:hypothetical protein